jgi:outer membrane protein assembly factor BamB
VLFTCSTARAQILYVLQNQAALVGIVSTYNATTGAVLNPSLIAGLREPQGLAINSNSNPPVIFVAADHVIGKYNATTGSAINPVFIHTNPLGARPHFLLLSGTTLYVGSDGTEIDTYDATTGAKIKVPFISGIGSISGLALSGNVLYVSDRSARKVDEYDASTGVLNTSFSVVGGAPYCLAVYGGDIFVVQWGPAAPGLGGQISKYSLTGTPIDLKFITTGDPGPFLLSGSTLYIGFHFDFPPPLSEHPTGGLGTIGKYNAATGVGTSSFISGLNFPSGLVITVPAP